MKVTLERMPESQVVLNIEIDPERVESSLNQAYKRLAPRAKVPGFRPGKAPRALIERHYGRETLLQEALDKLVPEVVAEAIESENVDWIDRPDMEVASLDPVVVRATVPVRPTIDLGNYRSLRVEREPVTVDAEKIDETLESLRHRYSTVEPVERAVENGDVIRADVRSTHDGNVLIEEEDAELTVTEEGLKSLPGLHPKLLGLTAGDAHHLEVIAPDDEPEGLAGTMISYIVTIKDVKAQTLPELDDEFAKEVGESFPTLQALRERLESDLKERLESEADSKLEDEALKLLVEGATIEFPPQIVEREIERMLKDQGVPSDDRRQMERLLQRAGLSEEQVRAEFRPQAIERVRRSLVMGQLREQEAIAVMPDDIEAELTRMTEGMPGNAEQVRALFGTEQGREIIERNLIGKRTLERLRQIALGEAPELTSVAAETPDAEARAEATAEVSDDAPPAEPESAPTAPDAARQVATEPDSTPTE